MSDKILEVFQYYMPLVFLVLIGVLSRRAFEVSEGRKMYFFERALLLDLAMMAPGVFIGAGFNEQLGLTGNTAAAVMVLTGYAGWRVIMVAFAKRNGIDIDLGDKKP